METMKTNKQRKRKTHYDKSILPKKNLHRCGFIDRMIFRIHSSELSLCASNNSLVLLATTGTSSTSTIQIEIIMILRKRISVQMHTLFHSSLARVHISMKNTIQCLLSPYSKLLRRPCRRPWVMDWTIWFCRPSLLRLPFIHMSFFGSRSFFLRMTFFVVLGVVVIAVVVVADVVILPVVLLLVVVLLLLVLILVLLLLLLVACGFMVSSPPLMTNTLWEIVSMENNCAVLVMKPFVPACASWEAPLPSGGSVESAGVGSNEAVGCDETVGRGVGRGVG